MIGGLRIVKISIIAVPVMLLVLHIGSLHASEEQQKHVTHVDKHITHEEGPALQNGLNIAAGMTSVVQGTSGNDKNATPGEDVIDGNYSVDLEVSSAMGENGEAFFALEVGNGTGLTEELDTFWGFNADAGPESKVEIAEMWYEHRFRDGMIIFTAGEVDLTNYFDGNEVANDETTQFLSDGFINDLTAEFPSGPGARLTVSPDELIEISVGFQSDGWEDMDKNAFLIAEADIKPIFNELAGTYRLYAWANKGDHTDANDPTKTEESGSGFGISADQQIMNNVSIFGRYGMRNDDIAEYEFDKAWSAGVAMGGSMWGRESDVIGVAYGRAMSADHYKSTITNPADEGHFEAYYRVTINDQLAVSPDIQVVTNAKGDEDFENVIIGSVRGQFTF